MDEIAADMSILQKQSERPTSQERSASSRTVQHQDRINDVEKNAATEQPTSEPESDRDPNVVDWQGPDDLELPINWPQAKRWRNVMMVSTLTFLTPFASSMFAPAINQVMEEMNTTNRDIGSFGVSIYLLGYAFGPLVLGPSSELYGRIIVYHCCSVLFLIFNLGCALAINMPMLIIFRFLCGLVGACPLTIGPGTVSDCFRQEERGRAMAIWTMPVLLGPCLGPAIGAYVSRALGWTWNFWLLMIMAGSIFIFSLIFQQETHPPTLLKHKARDLRKSTGNPNLHPPADATKPRLQLFTTSVTRPIEMLFRSPIVFGLSLLAAVAYGMLYLLFTTITEVFSTRYGIVTNVGLVYLGIGCGQFVGLSILGIVSDAIVKRKAIGGEMKPEYRLPPMVPGASMIPIGLLIYGWSAQHQIFWFVPIIGTFLVGLGMITVFTPVATYLVDAFPTYAASATAANTVFRSIGGALLPLAGPQMYKTLDQGWGNTLLAAISLLMIGMIVMSLKYGEYLRTHPRYQLEL